MLTKSDKRITRADVVSSDTLGRAGAAGVVSLFDTTYPLCDTNKLIEGWQKTAICEEFHELRVIS